MSRFQGLLAFSCGLLANCSAGPPRPELPLSRAWDPDYAVRGCRDYNTGTRAHPRTEAHCVRTPVPHFLTAATVPLNAGRNLIGADMRGADLSEANLTYANLDEANLRGAVFYAAGLYRASLRDADLSGANLGYADLSEADLTRAQLDGANLTGADLDGAKATQAELRDVVWSETTCPDGTSSDHDGASCEGHLATRP